MSRFFNFRSALACAAAIALVSTVGCSSTSANNQDNAPVSADAIPIGLISDFTGPGGLFGEPTELAAKLAVQEINAAGGVNGKQVNLVVADEGSDPSTGVSVVKRLIDQDKIVALFGQHNSATRDAVQPITAESSVPYFYAAVNEGALCAQNLFVTGEVPSQLVGPAVPWVQQETGKLNWFLLGNDYTWPRTTFEAAKKIIVDAGGKVVGEEYVPMGTTDFQAIISKIKASGADIMIPALVGSDAIAFEKQAFDVGLGNEAVQRLGLLYEANTRQAFGAAIAEGMLNTVGYDEAIVSTANESFLESYYAAFGDNAPIQTNLSIQSYVAIKAWAEAANSAGTTALDSITKSLVGTPITAPSGTVTIEESHFMTQPIFVTVDNSDGTTKILHSFDDVVATEVCTF